MEAADSLEQSASNGHVSTQYHALPRLEDERFSSVIQDRQRAPQRTMCLIEPCRWRRAPDRIHGATGVVDGVVLLERRTRSLEPLPRDLHIIVGEQDDVAGRVVDTAI